MDNVLLDIIEEIIELIEDEKAETYAYSGNKFNIIDKENNIDFQAKLSNNNYYFKDNISGLSYMKVKKYINDNTKIQQLLIEEDKEKCYYSYLERDGYVTLVRAIRTDGEKSLVCNNMNVLNHTWEEIEEYADECFENITNLDDIKAIEYNPNQEDEEEIAEREDEEIAKVFGNVDDIQDGYAVEEDEDLYENEYYDDDEPESEYYDEDDELENEDENEYEYEFNQIEENEKYGLSDIFEKNSIEDYETYIDKKEECAKNGERYNQNEDNLPMGEYSETIEEYYSNYTLVINGKEVDGQAKTRIIADCEAAIDEKAYDSSMFDMAVINLKAVLEALQKNIETNMKDGYEK